VLLDDAHPELPSELQKDTVDTITMTLPKLKSRHDQSTSPRRPEVAMVLCDDSPNWGYIYQALFMG